jgi:integrase
MQSISTKYAEYKLIRNDLRESSVEILDRAVDWFIQLHGDLDISQLNYGKIDDYKRWLSKGRSHSSSNTYLAMLKSFFSWLAKRRYIEFNPFDGITLYKTVQKQFEIYSLDEIKRLLSISNSLWRLIISLALCSMRESEILNLCVRDIDFDNRRIKITPKKDTKTTWRWDIKDSDEAYVGFDESISLLLINKVNQLEDMPYVCLKRCYWTRNLWLRDKGKLSQRKRNNPWGNFNRDFRALQKRA